MREQGMIKAIPISDYVAATSVGIVGGMPMLDLAYEEDSKADVDMNVVKTGDGRFIEDSSTPKVRRWRGRNGGLWRSREGEK